MPASISNQNKIKKIYSTELIPGKNTLIPVQRATPESESHPDMWMSGRKTFKRAGSGPRGARRLLKIYCDKFPHIILRETSCTTLVSERKKRALRPKKRLTIQFVNFVNV